MRAVEQMVHTVVVVGIEEALEARAALAFAAEEAGRRAGAVRLVCGYEPLWTLTDSDPQFAENRGRENAEQQLAAAATIIKPMLWPGTRVETVVCRGPGTRVLMHESAEAVLVVLDRRMRSRAARLATGSTTGSVAAQAPCPVVVVHEPATESRPSPVVVGVDDVGHSSCAVEVAFEEAAIRGGDLTALHVWSAHSLSLAYGWTSPTAQELAKEQAKAELGLSEALAGHGQGFPDVAVRAEVVEGNVHDVLLRAAEQAGLLVLGRHANRHARSFGLGGVARRFLDAAPCPVIITPAARPRRHRRSAGRIPTTVADPQTWREA